MISKFVTTFLATWLLATATWAPAAEAGCERLLDDVTETYGVEVVQVDVPVRPEANSLNLSASPVTRADLERYAPLLARELFLYPTTLVRKAKLRRIVLCKNLSLGGDLAGGLADSESATVYLDISPPPGNASFLFAAAIHHEFFHLLDYADDGVILEDERWLSLNPPGFEYGRQCTKGVDPRALEYVNDFPGFLTRYCLAAIEEDKAEVFSHLMVDASYVEERATRDPLLNAKVMAMRRILSDFCPDVDERFWQAAKRLQRPPPATPASVGDEHQLFLEALEQRQMFDTALDYVALMRTGHFLDDARKRQLPLDEGRLSLHKARGESGTAARCELLARACDRFANYVASNPEDPKLAGVRSELAMILIERGGVLLDDANRATNTTRAEALFKEARDVLREASSSLDAAAVALRGHLSELEKTRGTKSNASYVELRDEARGGILRARLYAAGVSRMLATAFPDGSPERSNFLHQAADRYGAIYQKHPRRIAGVTALLSQGECYEDLDDTRRAIANYEAAVSLKDAPALRALKATALNHIMKLLTSDRAKDYEAASSRGEKWLEGASLAETHSVDGLGIAYYTALADAALADALRTAEDQQLRKRLLRTAKKWASVVADAAQPANPHQDAARKLFGELCGCALEKQGTGN